MQRRSTSSAQSIHAKSTTYHSKYSNHNYSHHNQRHNGYHNFGHNTRYNSYRNHVSQPQTYSNRYSNHKYMRDKFKMEAMNDINTNVNEWDSTQLKQWIYSLHLNKRVAAKIANFITEHDITGQDLNSMANPSEIKRSFDIEEF
eukprot:87616_1